MKSFEANKIKDHNQPVKSETKHSTNYEEDKEQFYNVPRWKLMNEVKIALNS